MDLIVKEVKEVEEKTLQETEQELIDKANKEKETPEVDESGKPIVVDSKEKEDQLEITDDIVLKYFKDKKGKAVDSIDSLFEEKEVVVEKPAELPEDVQAYYDYKKKTGRTMSDYIKLNRDYDNMDSDQLLVEFFLATEEGLDKEDVKLMMEDFSYDEDEDDEARIRRVKLSKKKKIAEAKKFFNDQKEMYKEPIESMGSGIPDEEKEDYEAFKSSKQTNKATEESMEKKRLAFKEQTESVFTEEFKGFEFDIDGNKIVFNPSDKNSMMESQSDIMNFVGKYMDKDGVMNDGLGYHKALALAMNPEKFAKFFYEQGQAATVDNIDKNIKNINMKNRRTPEVTVRKGMTIKTVNEPSGSGLRIKQRSKN